jgi:hypothetical protein
MQKVTKMNRMGREQSDDDGRGGGGGLEGVVQGVTKRCRLSWLTNRALVYEPKCVGRGVFAGT